MSKTLSTAEAQDLYDQQDQQVAALIASGAIDEKSIHSLHRIGRVKLLFAGGWTHCTAPAKDALLNDPHPHVRSCAICSRDEEAAAA